jgi:hypothetical protein
LAEKIITEHFKAGNEITADVKKEVVVFSVLRRREKAFADA